MDSPAWEPELLLKVGAAGILPVQTSNEDKAGEHLPLTLVGRNNLYPSVSSPVGGPHQYEAFSCRKALGGCPGSSVVAACRAQESCPIVPLGKGFWPRSHLSCPVTLKIYPATIRMSNCAAEHP